MVKILLIFVLTTILSFGDVYENNCVKCHNTLSLSLQETFKKYLLVYSGEENIKAGIKHYLKYPSKDISVMSKLFKKIYGIKEKTTLNEEELNQAIDSYWDRYKVFGKLK
ncbi:MAG: Unknown protein [uncultured Sulfurovum sp.]|uniref:Cytochrome c domain-containing protein n=1 Tax=uncultured Sulfurovum sp. TaxID=269237 RepID=A0A6S6U8C6_9BACT|nr:MAG: Unknown protein [uncultured Sulfurovum sp.]